MIEAFLDGTPGETRGVIVRDGRPERLLIQRDDDDPALRLGARSVGRVVEVRPALGAAFVDIGADRPGFLSLKRDLVDQGDRLKVVVTAEPRDRKGPVLKVLGPGEGAPRLLAAAPDVAARLAAFAPRTTPATGAAAIRAGVEAEAEARAAVHAFPDLGLDLAVERTRALVAVDVDFAGPSELSPGKARDRANREALRQAARLIRLKSWGGLVVVDLAGPDLGAAQVDWAAEARRAFADDGAAPVAPPGRFGLLQLTLPWRARPIDDRPVDPVLDMLRTLRRTLLEDTGRPRVAVSVAPGMAERATSLAARLGPRAAVVADPMLAPAHWRIEDRP